MSYSYSESQIKGCWLFKHGDKAMWLIDGVEKEVILLVSRPGFHPVFALIDGERTTIDPDGYIKLLAENAADDSTSAMREEIEVEIQAEIAAEKEKASA